MTQILKDGSSFRRVTRGLIARDSEGRIRNERRQVVPASASQEPLLLEIHLYDPATGANLFLDPNTRVARQSTLAGPPHTVPPLNWAQNEPPGESLPPNVQDEDLGASVIAGFDVHGYRRTVTVPENLSGTGKPVNVVDEYWYSDDLQLDLVVKHFDPRTGSLAMTVRSININEPAVELLEVPPGFKIVDMTPPQQAEWHQTHQEATKP